MNQRALRDKSWGIYCDCKRNKGRWWTVRAVLPHPGAVSVHGFHFRGGAWLGVRGRGSFPRRGKTVSYTADEGFRLAKLSVDGLYLPVTEYPDSYTFSDIQKDHTLAVTFEPVPTATPTPTATATPTETPAITQTPEPAISKAPASSTVSFSSVASHFAAFWKGTVHAASWFRHLASAGASLLPVSGRQILFFWRCRLSFSF